MSMEQPTNPEKPETTADIIQFPEVQPEPSFFEASHKEQVKRVGSAIVAAARAAFFGEH